MKTDPRVAYVLKSRERLDKRTMLGVRSVFEKYPFDGSHYLNLGIRGYFGTEHGRKFRAVLLRFLK